MSLTPKQRAFVDAYLIDSNGKKAAIAAGYSPGSAAVEASRLLKHAKVAAEIANRRAPAKDDGLEVPTNRFKDPRDYLEFVMNDFGADPKLRADAAKALMPYMHQKLGEGGKKEQQQAEAEKAASRFRAAAPPKLVAAGGKQV
jgi:phage terminase small subunit